MGVVNGSRTLTDLVRSARDRHLEDALGVDLAGFVEEVAVSPTEARLLRELEKSKGIRRLGELGRKDIESYILSRWGRAVRDRLAANLSAWVTKKFMPVVPVRAAGAKPATATTAAKAAAKAATIPPLAPNGRRTARGGGSSGSERDPRLRFATAADLRAFADAHNVTPFLAWPAPVAPTAGHRPEAGPALAGRTIEEVLLSKPTGTGAAITALLQQHEQAMAELERFADNVAFLSRQADDHRRRPAHPAGETARRLVELLTRECAARAERWPARPFGAYIPAPLRFVEEPPRLLFEEGRDTRSSVVLGYRPPEQVAIHFEGYARGEIGVVCRCGAGARAASMPSRP
jgi:hypothetical protein